MKIKDIFRFGAISQVVGGTGEYLTDSNTVVVNKSKTERDILFHLRRESDGNEADIHFNVLPDYESISETLLNWAFTDDRMIGLSPSDIRDLDTNIQISSVEGKMQMTLI
jgi:hypothetical protein